MRTLSIIFLLLSNLCFAAKNDSAPQLLEQIKTSIGEAKCSENSQCKTIAIGAKPCGGPEQYLAWSTQQTDAVALENLASRYRIAREKQNAASGEQSDCRFFPDPGAICLKPQTNAEGKCSIQINTMNGKN